MFFFNQHLFAFYPFLSFVLNVFPFSSCISLLVLLDACIVNVQLLYKRLAETINKRVKKTISGMLCCFASVAFYATAQVTELTINMLISEAEAVLRPG